MMRHICLSIAVIAISLGSASASHKAGHKQNNSSAPGQDRVCLITFKTPAGARSGANADIQSTKTLPRKAAEKQENYRSGGTKRVFVYNDPNTCERLG